jgi:fatty-acyl-CoA synthase
MERQMTQVDQLRTLADIEGFESQRAFEERCDARSIYDIFQQSAARHPDRAALTMVLTGDRAERPRSISYRDLLDGITRSANYFHDLAGPAPGVAVMLPHLFETHFALWGAETAGYAVPINFLLQPDHLVHLLRVSGAKILVTLGPHPQFDIWAKALAVSKQLPNLRLVQVSVTEAALEPGVSSFSSALAAQNGSGLSFPHQRDSDNIAAYFHTGGTTGRPKLVAHTHRNQIVAAYGGATLLAFSDRDTMTHGLPLFHVAGTIYAGLSAFMSGVSLLVLSPTGLRNPEMIRNFWRIIEQYGVTVSAGVPTVLTALLGVPLDGADISSVRLFLSGAAAAPSSLIKQFEDKTGLQVHEIFGMTEAGGLISVSPAASERVIGSVGFRLPYTQTSIRKLNADGSLGDECAVRETGVLTIAGPTVTPGYRDQDNDDDAPSGFLNSGDLAYLDEAGRIHIVGRSKDLIIRSGHNIDPQMIEDVIQQHPSVSMAAAVGQPDKYAGELPVCYVALKPGVKANIEDLFGFARGRIGERPAWPKEIYIVPAIPVTALGKIFKQDLRVDATLRVVTRLVNAEIGQGNANIAVTAGNMRALAVTVTFKGDSFVHAARIEMLLQGYNFDCFVNSLQTVS